MQSLEIGLYIDENPMPSSFFLLCTIL